MQNKKKIALNGVIFNVTVNSSFTSSGLEDCSFSIDSAVVNGVGVSSEKGIEATGLALEEVIEMLGSTKHSIKDKGYER